MDSEARTRFAEAGKRRLEEFRKQKAAQKSPSTPYVASDIPEASAHAQTLEPPPPPAPSTVANALGEPSVPLPPPQTECAEDVPTAPAMNTIGAQSAQYVASIDAHEEPETQQLSAQQSSLVAASSPSARFYYAPELSTRPQEDTQISFGTGGHAWSAPLATVASQDLPASDSRPVWLVSEPHAAGLWGRGDVHNAAAAAETALPSLPSEGFSGPPSAPGDQPALPSSISNSLQDHNYKGAAAEPSFTAARISSVIENDLFERNTMTRGTNSENGSPRSSRGNIQTKKDFRELQHHIDELTEEKFTLQRCLEQQTLLADRLIDENEALAKKLNDAAVAVEAAGHEVQAARWEVSQAKSAATEAQAERDAYEMSTRESAERIKKLAAEVVALEEKMLRYRSEELRQQKKSDKACESLESLPNSADADASLVALTKALQTTLEDSVKEKNTLEAESRAAKAEGLRIRAELQTAKEAAEQAQRAQKQAEAALHEAKKELQKEMGMHTRHHLKPAATENGDTAIHREEEEHRQQDRLPSPPPSALIAAVAMEKFDAMESYAESQPRESILPPQVLALLPPTTWIPGTEGLDPGVADVVERIFQALEILEKGRGEAAKALARQQDESETLRTMNVQLQGRLEALQAQLELGAQQRVEAEGAHRH